MKNKRMVTNKKMIKFNIKKIMKKNLKMMIIMKIKMMINKQIIIVNNNKMKIMIKIKKILIKININKINKQKKKNMMNYNVHGIIQKWLELYMKSILKSNKIYHQNRSKISIENWVIVIKNQQKYWSNKRILKNH